MQVTGFARICIASNFTLCVRLHRRAHNEINTAPARAVFLLASILPNWHMLFYIVFLFKTLVGLKLRAFGLPAGEQVSLG